MKKKSSKKSLDISKYEVSVKELRWNYEKKLDSTQKKPHSGRLSEIIGQDKAVKAIEFGLAMGDAPGYNIFATGPEGVGKLTAVKEILEERVKKLSTNLTDQCAVYNFDAPDKPLILTFEAGKGIRFKEELNKFLEDIYTKSLSAIQEEVNKNNKELESKISPLKEEVVKHLKEKDIDFDIDDKYKIEINYGDKENIEEDDAILDSEI
ncbi:AAA family ATPase [Candidatus Woesearchaeota archaeon]|nr:AAA family ATPase [Candidatus Woesearchaeota archaeon]